MKQVLGSILKWLFDAGVKFVTKLLRVYAKVDGVPDSELPTEGQIKKELGYTALKTATKLGVAYARDKLKAKFTAPVSWARQMFCRKDISSSLVLNM